MHSGPGEYRGFFWFYFFNEHLLRFLNLRYPRDYNTVPRAVVLAVESGLAVSVVGVSACRVKQSYRDAIRERTGKADGGLLDWRGHGVFHLLHHAGVLLHADLSCAGIAARLGAGFGRQTLARRHVDPAIYSQR